MPRNNENGASLLTYVKGQSRRPDPKSYRGLDLGQRHDYSALASLELTWTNRGTCPLTFATQFQPEVAITALTRFPFGTDYEELHHLVTNSLATDFRAQELVIDAGGPGAPMVDRLRATLPAHIDIRPVLCTTGAGNNTLAGGYTGIPRRTLITNLLLTITANSLLCDEGLPNWPIFENELVGLGGDTYHPAASNGHDDLVIAVALALSAAIRDTPELLPSLGGPRPAHVPFGFIDKRLF